MVPRAKSQEGRPEMSHAHTGINHRNTLSINSNLLKKKIALQASVIRHGGIDIEVIESKHPLFWQQVAPRSFAQALQT